MDEVFKMYAMSGGDPTGKPGDLGSGQVDAFAGCQVGSEERGHAAWNQAAGNKAGGVDDALWAVAHQRTGRSEFANPMVVPVDNPDIPARIRRDTIGIVELRGIAGAAVARKSRNTRARNRRQRAARAQFINPMPVEVRDV